MLMTQACLSLIRKQLQHHINKTQVIWMFLTSLLKRIFKECGGGLKVCECYYNKSSCQEWLLAQQHEKRKAFWMSDQEELRESSVKPLISEKAGYVTTSHCVLASIAETRPTRTDTWLYLCTIRRWALPILPGEIFVMTTTKNKINWWDFRDLHFSNSLKK